MFITGRYGIPFPSGLKYAPQTVCPTASSVERTMFWLDRLAEQHGWTSHYSSNPLISSNGFVWKRPNGNGLETFVPIDQPGLSGTYGMQGRPIGCKDFYQNYREIINFVQYHNAIRGEVYGGQTLSLAGGSVSGFMWKGQWNPQGNYTNDFPSYPIKLDNPSYDSFVDFRDSSHTKYTGRHGKLSSVEYNQYLAPVTERQYALGYSFSAYRGGSATRNTKLNNYNTVAYDFETTDNDYNSTIFNDAKNQTLECVDWQIKFPVNDTIYTQPLNGYVASYAKAKSTMRIITVVLGSGFPFAMRGDEYGILGAGRYHNSGLGLSDMASFGSTLISGVNVPDIIISSGRYDGLWLFTVPSQASFNYLNIPETVHTENLNLNVYGDYDYGGVNLFSYRLDEAGHVTSTRIYDVKELHPYHTTHELYSLSVEGGEQICGLLIPNSRTAYPKYSQHYSASDINHYLRSLTGYVPSDSLDVTSQAIRYSYSNEIDNAAFYNRVLTISQANSGDYSMDRWYYGVNYGLAYSGIFKNDCTRFPGSSFPEHFYDTNTGFDLIYGYIDIDLSGNLDILGVEAYRQYTQNYTDAPYKAVCAKIDAGDYNVLSSFGLPDYIHSGSRNVLSPQSNNGLGSFVRDTYESGHTCSIYLNEFRSAVPEPYPRNPKGVPYGHHDYLAWGNRTIELIGSIQSLVDNVPSGNALFLVLKSQLSMKDKMNALPYPTMETFSHQQTITQELTLECKSPFGYSFGIIGGFYNEWGSWSYWDQTPYELPPTGSRYTYTINIPPITYKSCLLRNVDAAASGFDLERYMGQIAQNGYDYPFGYPLIGKWGSVNDVTSCTFTTSNSSILAKQTSYGARPSGAYKFTVNAGFGNVHSDNDVWYGGGAFFPFSD